MSGRGEWAIERAFLYIPGWERKAGKNYESGEYFRAVKEPGARLPVKIRFQRKLQKVFPS